MHSLKDLIFVFLRFFGAYGLMLYFYNKYLENQSKIDFIDPITKEIASQVSILLNKIGYLNQLKDMASKNAMAIYFDQPGRIVSYINEGCNAISIMIIFIAFCFAFYSDFFKTIGYLVFGLVIIYFSNIFRIVLLNIIYFKYNDYAKFSHDIIFPIIIYGTIMLLWVYWIYSIQINKKEIGG